VKKILVFHPIIAPYRIDFFNALNKYYKIKVCLLWRNLKDQNFNYSKIESQFDFNPCYLIKDELGVVTWVKKIWLELSDYTPDLVYVNEFGILTILVLIHRRLTGSKYKIVSITDDSYNMLACDNHFTFRHKYAVKLLAPLLDDFQTVEPMVAEWYKKRLGKGMYFPIICDEKIAIARQKKILPISERIVKEYHLEGKKVLLFVGRLVKLKNIEFTIKAFVKANIQDSIFVIVGNGEQECSLKALAKPYSNVKLVGRFEGDDLYAWYNVANIITLQSTQEAFGAVTNEALVAGCFALVSKYAGSNCLIEDGKNGYVIDPYSEDDYINKLFKLMEMSKPICLPLSVRTSKMNITFQECMNKLTDRFSAM